MNETEFLNSFMQMESGLSASEVERLFGLPNEINELTVPKKSGWGTQKSFWIKIEPGAPYLEWVYHIGKTHFTVWFAKVDDRWMISYRIPIEKTFREEHLL